MWKGNSANCLMLDSQEFWESKYNSVTIHSALMHNLLTQYAIRKPKYWSSIQVAHIIPFVHPISSVWPFHVKIHHHGTHNLDFPLHLGIHGFDKLSDAGLIFHEGFQTDIIPFILLLKWLDFLVLHRSHL